MFIGTMIDITESKHAQERLLATQSELARVSQLTTIGQMAASIAHEIKQPITSIVMGASAGLRWLTRDPPNLKEARACLELIANNGDRANQVIDGIRAMFQKGGRGKELLDINQIIRETLELVRGAAHKKLISLESELSEDLRPVFGNRIQLQQVMLNLFSNAIEAMDTGTHRTRGLQWLHVVRPRERVNYRGGRGAWVCSQRYQPYLRPLLHDKISRHGNGVWPVARRSPEWAALRALWR